MPPKARNHKLPRAALCVVSGFALLVAGSAAVRAGDGDGTGGDRPYTKFFNNLMSSMGLRDQEPGVEYGERPPLVVPPGRDLPPPAAAGSTSPKTAAWPSDPDAAKRRAADRSKQRERSVLAGDRANDAAPTSQPEGTGTWDKLTGWTKSITGGGKESATFLREPSRGSLTDPPAGYRTPAPDQPYGINGSTSKPKSDIDRQAATVNGPPSPK